MKLTIKNVLNGVVVSTISASFNEVGEYIAFLDKIGIQIDLFDAAQDMHNAEVEMVLPCTSVSNELSTEAIEQRLKNRLHNQPLIELLEKQLLEEGVELSEGQEDFLKAMTDDELEKVIQRGSLSSIEEAKVQQLEFDFKEAARFERSSELNTTQVDLYAKKH